jgi:hypothetical protein
MPDAVVIRLGKGNSTLSELYSGCNSLIIYWTKANTMDFQFVRLEGTKVNLRQLIGENYPNTRFIQIMLPSEEQYQVQQTVDSLPIPTQPSALDDDGRLSAIPEEDTPVPSSRHSEAEIMAVFGVHDEDNIQELDQALTSLLEEPEEEPDQEIDVQGLEKDPELSMYWVKQQDDEPGAHIYLDKQFEKLYLGAQLSTDDQDTVLRIYQGSMKTVVIKRDTDVLTKDEEIKCWKELQAAMLEELRIWVKYKCFHMRPKQGARNIMDSRNVLKWKWVKDETGKNNRIIRCRLALRGFKDQDADWLETCAGTAGRTSQRILTSEAANHSTLGFPYY